MSAEVLPYTVKPHPVTGLYSGKLGLWLFLASEVMLFGAMFSTYILLRVGDPAWPSHHDTHLSVPIGMANTLILITSSVSMVMAWAACKMNDLAKAKRYLGITLALAVTFLVIKVSFEYVPKTHHYGVWLAGSTEAITGHIESETPDEIVFQPDAGHGAEHDAHPEIMHIKRADIERLSAFVPSYSTYFATYYTMTGLHGLHILGGILVIGYLMGPGSKMWKDQPERYANRLECTGLYWHFVDLVWIFLFPVFYLL
ncbi:MAG: heme-copper oxidase subunit III [Phycisphaerae bacterium]